MTRAALSPRDRYGRHGLYTPSVGSSVRTRLRPNDFNHQPRHRSSRAEGVGWQSDAQQPIDAVRRPRVAGAGLHGDECAGGPDSRAAAHARAEHRPSGPQPPQRAQRSADHLPHTCPANEQAMAGARPGRALARSYRQPEGRSVSHHRAARQERSCSGGRRELACASRRRAPTIGTAVAATAPYAYDSPVPNRSD